LPRPRHPAAAVRRLRQILHWRSVVLEPVTIATTPTTKAAIVPSRAVSAAPTSIASASIIALELRRQSVSIVRALVTNHVIALHRVASVAPPSTRAGTILTTTSMWAKLNRQQTRRHLQIPRPPQKLPVLLNPLPRPRAPRAGGRQCTCPRWALEGELVNIHRKAPSSAPDSHRRQSIIQAGCQRTCP
jgi:hypothetical protein